ncbi:putative trans-zeatin O-beta-D-glucosyltransferase [Helianthus annuus]|nr:putative trans-zeatin O-beta-D-glucosyltransferase [Helianthus annuus]
MYPTHNNHNSKMTSEVAVVMVPFVAQGHLNQLLHLSHLISAYNIPIHFISTATHIRQARIRLHGWNSHNNLIQFHELPDPDFISPHPNPNGTVSFPTHLQPVFNSSLRLRGPVADFVRSLAETSRRVAVVHDSAMSYVVQDVKFMSNVTERATVCTEDVATVTDLPSSDETMSGEFMEFVKLQYEHQTFHVGNIYDSSRVIEGTFLESLEREGICGKNHWAVGPFNPVEIQTDVSNSDRHASLKWLDKQPERSVVYVSFGTTTTFTVSQIRELAMGLEKSEQRFLWVVEGRGLVVREWAPQVEILGHLSVGGFVSHCGWNSCMEAMTCGVAVAAWPIHSDQPRNAFLFVEVLKVALMMREWACRDKLLTSVMVEKVVRRLMDTKEGAAIRKRAAEVGGELRRSLANGGISRKELDSLIAYIRR